MAESYIPEGTDVICTLMQKGPNKIGLGDRTSYVAYKGKNAPLLNISDKKISESFQCKNASKFWGGLQALCAGIAIGAIVVLAVAATVLTGGAAAIFIGAIAFTAGVSLGAGIIGLYKTAHDCDVIKDSTWSLPHDTVRIEGKKALLNRSFISCSKGGKVTIIVDPVIAQNAAEIITSNNQKEVLSHMGSQFVMGIITGATSASPLALAAASPLAVYSYNDAESKEQEQRSQNQERDPFWTQAGDALGDEGRDAAIGLPGDIYETAAELTTHNQTVYQEIRDLGTLAATREAAGDVSGAMNARIAQQMASNPNSFKGLSHFFKDMGKGLGIGLAAGVVNFGIDQWSNSYEDQMHKGSSDEIDDAEREDKNTSIGIIATDA
ncbi:MAG: hypothetical protein LBE92_05535 [Chryseobacterium sp.]|jgi:hypothetical protein|uniref:hypothetical protein n=1 Tax=Chryseobacterium sp. TaxID=1871047 RepID=UPI00281E5DA3|nr:hypothetical protein [Chryseobacterium sp.]MDR2235564.1 hypothetical protein [Chryseobacterium sp.]